MNQDSTFFDSYLPVFDSLPDDWEDAKPALLEFLRKISETVNVREIGWFLDEELLSGKQFIPSNAYDTTQGIPAQFRSIFRKVIEFPAGLTSGPANSQPHGIIVDAAFKLISMFGAATNANTLTGEPLPNGPDTISYDATNVYVTVASNYTYGVVTMEYIQEL